MWATIAKWAGSKIVVVIVAVLALCGIIFTPVAVYQAFEINGYQILWWGAPGLKAQLETAQDTNKTLTNSVTNLTGGLKTCNASVDAAEAAGVKKGKDTQKAADAKQAGVDAALKEQGRLFAIKPGANALVTAQSVALTGREP